MIQKLKVNLAFDKDHIYHLGSLIKTGKRQIYFEFDAEWLKGPISISPFKLPQIPGLQIPSSHDAKFFDGLFGVFSDSLPDSWGRLVLNRRFKKLGLDIDALSSLDYLACLGTEAIGALTYEPEINDDHALTEELDLQSLARDARALLEGSSKTLIPDLLKLGGSPGGARPKVLVGVQISPRNSAISLTNALDPIPEGYDHWLIKFRAPFEHNIDSKMEYIYSQVARKIGLLVPDSHLFETEGPDLYFGIKRFDRIRNQERFHVHTLAGLLHADFRLPCLDYEDILKCTHALTRQEHDLHAAFKWCVFNAIFHNRDDHAKNLSFMMNREGQWRLAPFYDLCFSKGPGGEHTTSYLGEGKFPSPKILMKLAQKTGIAPSVAKSTIEEVSEGIPELTRLMKDHEIATHPLLKWVETWRHLPN